MVNIKRRILEEAVDRGEKLIFGYTISPLERPRINSAYVSEGIKGLEFRLMKH